jgi:hypothetical protein
VVSQVPSYNHFALLVLTYRCFRTSTLQGVGPLLSHIVLISCTTSCTHHVWSIQENVTSTHAKAYFGLEVSHQWKLSASAWNLIEVFSIQSIWWSCKKKGIRWLLQPNRSGHSAMSPTHKRKRLHERSRSSPPGYPDILLSPRSMCPSSFLVLPTSLHKSQGDIYFKGGGL